MLASFLLLGGTGRQGLSANNPSQMLLITGKSVVDGAEVGPRETLGLAVSGGKRRVHVQNGFHLTAGDLNRVSAAGSAVGDVNGDGVAGNGLDLLKHRDHLVSRVRDEARSGVVAALCDRRG